MRCDLAGVTPFVLYHGTLVPVGRNGWRFERTRSSIQGSSIRSVGVVDINVEEGGHRTSRSGVTNHDHRVADPDLGWARLPVLSRSAEHLLQELDKVFCLVNHDSRCDGVPAFRGEGKTVRCFLHNESLRFEVAADA